MSLPKKCVGFVYKMYMASDDGAYYRAIGDGQCHHKKDAYVYTLEELQVYVTSDLGWGGKVEGKWIVVWGTPDEQD